MQETPQYHHLSPFSPTPQQTPPPELPKKTFKKAYLYAAAGLVVVAIAAVLVIGMRHKDKDNAQAGKQVPVSQQSLTLYYRDGKTVMYESKAGAAPTKNEQPAFAGHVQSELANKYSNDYQKQGAWKVTTTLDASMQQKAHEQMQANKDSLASKNHVADAAFVAEDVTNGQIVAWVGGYDEKPSAGGGKPADRLTKKTIVGTAMLPITYAAIIDNSDAYGAGTKMLDAQLKDLQGYPCTNGSRPQDGGNCLVNFDYQYAGELTLRQALGAHRLPPTVKAAQETQGTGLTKLYATSKQLGSDATCYLDETLEEDVPCYNASTYGDGLYATPAHMLEAQAALANNGLHTQQTGILSLVINGKAQGSSQTKLNQAVRPDTAYIINDILADPQATYARPKASLFTTGNGTHLATIFGSNSDYHNVSFMQASSHYVAGVWAYGDSTQLVGSVPETGLSPIVYNFMDSIHAGGATTFQKPSDIKSLDSPVFTIRSANQMVGPSPAVDIYPAWYKP